MSRIGNRILTVPENVNVAIEEGTISVKGPKGSLDFSISNDVVVKLEGNTLTVERTDSETSNINQGTTNSIIPNMIEGVTKGVKDKLAILLKAIAANEGNRVPDYKEATGLPDSSMERYIKQLRDGGLIEVRGEAAHTGGYYLTKKMKSKLK